MPDQDPIETGVPERALGAIDHSLVFGALDRGMILVNVSLEIVVTERRSKSLRSVPKNTAHGGNDGDGDAMPSGADPTATVMREDEAAHRKRYHPVLRPMSGCDGEQLSDLRLGTGKYGFQLDEHTRQDRRGGRLDGEQWILR